MATTGQHITRPRHQTGGHELQAQLAAQFEEQLQQQQQKEAEKRGQDLVACAELNEMLGALGYEDMFSEQQYAELSESDRVNIVTTLAQQVTQLQEAAQLQEAQAVYAVHAARQAAQAQQMSPSPQLAFQRATYKRNVAPAEMGAQMAAALVRVRAQARAGEIFRSFSLYFPLLLLGNSARLRYRPL